MCRRECGERESSCTSSAPSPSQTDEVSRSVSRVKSLRSFLTVYLVVAQGMCGGARSTDV